MWIANNYLKQGDVVRRAFSLETCHHVQNLLRQSIEPKKVTRQIALAAWRISPQNTIAMVATLRKGLR